MSDFVASTDDTLSATLKYLIFNVHAAASYNSPSAPALKPQSSRLPSPADLIGNLFNSNISSALYTASLLKQQRSNLNSSWLNVVDIIRPDPAYYSSKIVDNVSISPDGWPSESYMEFQNARRLLIAYGTIDPQMEDYHADADSIFMFSQHLLDNTVNVTLAADGTVSSGCIFNYQNTSLPAANSSWAVSSDMPTLSLTDLSPPYYNSSLPAVGNLTACGISPILNQTLGNATADVNIAPYQEFVYSAIWSWYKGEPQTKADDSSNSFRCAALDSSIEGRWRVNDCRENHHAACRTNGQPHVWTLTSAKSHYTAAEDNCPANATFAVPRTALENQYLLGAYREAVARDKSIANDVVWINFNSLDVASCWVTGVNATCPYTPVARSNGQSIIVPVVAAIIVIVLAIFMVLVKCGANRQKSRKRRNADDGWDYEGVPS